jgi:hypothetical protein
VRQPAYWSGWDIARAVAMRPDGRGGYLLDGYGGLHPFGGAPRLHNPHYGRGDRARGLVLLGTGSTGYVVDADGRVLPVGQAPSLAPSRTWVGRGLTRGVIPA